MWNQLLLSTSTFHFSILRLLLPTFHHPFQIMRAYLRDKVLPGLRGKRDAQLLEALGDAWENHQLMDKWMGKFFRYLVSLICQDNGAMSLPGAPLMLGYRVMPFLCCSFTCLTAF